MTCDNLVFYAIPQHEANLLIQNGGDIRASIYACPITIEEMIAVLPFGNIHSVVEDAEYSLISALWTVFLQWTIVRLQKDPQKQEAWY